MKKCAAIILLNLGSIYLNAQESFPNAGNDASSGSGSVAYTIGQSCYTNLSSSSGNVSQGVQQPYEIYSLNAETINSNISLQLYPNPTQDVLHLKMDYSEYSDAAVCLFDLNSKIILTKKITSNITLLDLGFLSAGTYLVNVTLNSNTIQTFRIIKN